MRLSVLALDYDGTLETAEAHFDGHLRRRDFSRWIGDVFGDYPLATELRSLEDAHRASPSPDTIPRIANAIRGRYDLTTDRKD